MTKIEKLTHNGKTYYMFTFPTTNNVEVTAVILNYFNSKIFGSWGCVAYAQNRLFTCKLTFKERYFTEDQPEEGNPIVLDKVLDVEVFIDYAVIPECDELLAKYNN